MALTVLNNWGVHRTGDFGEIVYNLIRIKHMKKSDQIVARISTTFTNFATAFEPVFALSNNDDV